jgi:Anti-sigma factor NepR
VAAESGKPELDQGGKSGDMQTYPDNGTDDAAQSPIDKDIRNHLGRKLKASYDELVRQPVPDKFRQLLEELERQEKKK